ncbi:MAG: TolC family protein [Planctomycetaceae bacterium]
MSGFLSVGLRALPLLLLFQAVGCRAAHTVATTERPTSKAVVPSEAVSEETAPPAPEDDEVAESETASRIQMTSLVDSTTESERSEVIDAPLIDQDELQLDWLVAEVLRRNPNRQAAIAAWQAAAQRYPQAVALDDPLLQTMISPSGLASDQVNGAYMVGVAQKVPWSGKRELRGTQSQWEQTATQWDARDTDLRLTEAAKLAYFEYYLTARRLEVNAESGLAVREYRDTARSKYETGQVTQQDVLQTDVELAQLARRHIELEREQHIAVARINTLLHRLPTTALPPPPQSLEIDGELPPSEVLSVWAVESRPDLLAMSARIQSERASIELARKEFYPDFEFMARYDAFWQEQPLRPMVGMNMNVPINQRRRHAAVNEAIFRLNKMCAEYTAEADNVRNDVQAAYERLTASRQIVELYDSTILQAAEANVAAANAEYTAGTVDFLRLVAAQREVIELREQRFEAVAEYHVRKAELERLVGRPAVN